MKKIGVFGGTFNPVHNGHVWIAQSFFARLGLELMYIIPTNIPPHKAWNDLASGEERLEMCSLAFKGREGFAVSDMELRREGASYTLTTIKELREMHSCAKFYLIVGSDMYLTFQTWYGFPELSKLVTVCTAPRNVLERDDIMKHQKKLDAMGVMSVVYDLKIVPVSSTQVRRTIKEGGDISGLVPPLVRDYVIKRGLYR